MKSEQFSVYDSVDDETVTNYNEFQLASLVYFAMKESATSEQSSRMTAMDGASKNAGKSCVNFKHISMKVTGQIIQNLKISLIVDLFISK